MALPRLRQNRYQPIENGSQFLPVAEFRGIHVYIDISVKLRLCFLSGLANLL